MDDVWRRAREKQRVILKKRNSTNVKHNIKHRRGPGRLFNIFPPGLIAIQVTSAETWPVGSGHYTGTSRRAAKLALTSLSGQRPHGQNKFS